MCKKKSYSTYVIQSECGRKYIGFSSNPVKRLEEHNKEKSTWTKRYKSWKIIYLKKFENLSDARKWENYLKKQKGGRGFWKIINKKKKVVS